MLGFLSHTNTIRVDLYSYYVSCVLRIQTQYGSIRARYKITNQLIDPLIDQCITQYKHSLQKISIKNIHTNLTQIKTDDGLDTDVWTGFVCLFISLFMALVRNRKRSKQDCLWLFHDQKLMVGGKRGKWQFLPRVVFLWRFSFCCGFIAQFLWFSSHDQKLPIG